MRIQRAPARTGSLLWAAMVGGLAACAPPRLPGVWAGSVQHDGSPIEVTLEIAESTVGDRATAWFHPDDAWSRYDLTYTFGDLEAEGHAGWCGGDTCRWHASGQLSAVVPDLPAEEVPAGAVVVLGMWPEGAQCFNPDLIGEFMPDPPLQFQGELVEGVVSTLQGLGALDPAGCDGAPLDEEASFTRG